MRGERGVFIGAGEYLCWHGTLGSAVGPEVTVPARARVVPGLRRALFQDRAAGLRLYNRLAGVCGDFRNVRQVSKEVENEVSSLPASRPLTRSLMQSLFRCFELDLLLEANIRAARAALATERYRLDTGRFPASLEVLTPKYLPKVPSDPFIDQPLRYRVDEQLAVIYSVGEDLKDDGGQVEFLAAPGKRTDAGFVLLPPARRGLPATQPASAPEEHQ